MSLNLEQTEACNIIAKGHNLVLLGSAGTGKSYTVKHIIKQLSDQQKNIAVTATTGIASSIYDNAMTIHKWSGIGDGRYGTDAIQGVVKHNASFSEVRRRIMTTDVLVIDECSMMSKNFFLSLNEVCKIRNTSLPFLGLQNVLCGISVNYHRCQTVCMMMMGIIVLKRPS